MGLDQYARARSGKIRKKTDFKRRKTDRGFHYWRNHRVLHEWMYLLYSYKGGKKDEEGFNCAPVVLDEADLDELEKAIRESMLPHSAGYFFGQSSDEVAKDDLEFIAKAREEIKNGNSVYYSSWW